MVVLPSNYTLACVGNQCCNIGTAVLLPTATVGSTAVSQAIMCALLVTGLVLLCCIRRTSAASASGAGGSQRYIVLTASSDAYNSNSDLNNAAHAANVNHTDDTSRPQKWFALSFHVVYFAVTTSLMLLVLALQFLPGYSPAVVLVRIVSYQLKDAMPVFLVSVLFWREWRSKRSIVLSTFFALACFGVATTLPLAISRAMAASAGLPRIDVALCLNCPAFFMDALTIFPAIVYTLVWGMATFLVLMRSIRTSGRPLVLVLLFYYLAELAAGGAIAGAVVPLGVCVMCVLQLVYAVALPVLLVVTIIRDSRFVSPSQAALEESGSLDDAGETSPLLSENSSSAGATGAAASSKQLQPQPSQQPSQQTAPVAAPAAPSRRGSSSSVRNSVSISPMRNSKNKIMTEQQRIAKFLLDNLESSVRVVDFNQVIKEQKIGSGGFGEVFKGMLNGEEIAIKRVLDMDERKVKTFLREVNTMSRLKHPNIVVLVGVAISDADSYLLTEFVKRGSLFDLIHAKRNRARTHISWANAITVLRGTVLGMSYLHSMDPPFLHRDLKSQNLLIADNWVVKICDFGMARVRSLAVTMTKLGTLQWVAPEVLREERYSEKADIYSFAILVWELVARRVPYVGLNSLMVARAVAFKGLRPDIPDHCPEVLSSMMKMCWADDSAVRPSFDEIMSIIDNDIGPEIPLQWKPIPENE